MFCEHCGNGAKCIVCGRNDLREQVPTARFWQWINNGWVKISLRRAGERAETSHFWRTDEGWASSWSAWEHTGDGVLLESGTGGVDCDGRLDERFSSCWCPLAALMAREPYRANEYEWTPPGVPEWEKRRRSQRDHFAEAAGY